jgi:preprotein translocase subunit SecD
MIIGVGRFNAYLLLVVAALAIGCKSAEERRQARSQSTLRLHMEAAQGVSESDAVIEIAGAKLSVNNDPFLDERSIITASVVDTRDGGFAIRVQYDKHGTLVLDSVTRSNRGRHFAIFTQFGHAKLEQTRWLGAPYIGSAIAGGVLLFTPNCTREEAEQVVEGLRNVAQQLGTKDEF